MTKTSEADATVPSEDEFANGGLVSWDNPPFIHKCIYEVPASVERMKNFLEELDRLNEDVLD